MSDPLAMYLHDHLAGAGLAIDLLGAMKKRYQGIELGDFATRLSVEVEADRMVLQNLAKQVGAGSSPLKEAGAWLTEKVSRLKLGRDEDGLGAFEALEFLALGILGKLALWEALEIVKTRHSQLGGFDFPALAERARKQHAQVEHLRLGQAEKSLLRED